MIKQRVCHARAQRKVPVLKLKSFCKRLVDKNEFEFVSINTPSTKTITAEVRLKTYTSLLGGYHWWHGEGVRIRMNQRQRRKQWRNAPFKRHKK
jgi:hypothetical protein